MGYSGGTYEGKRLYNKESSVKITSHIKHWNKELYHFVENGGTLFVILCKKEEFYIYSGSKDISGTGRNQKITNHVAPLSNYDFFRINYSKRKELDIWFNNLYYHYYEGIAKETEETLDRGYIIYGRIHDKLLVLDNPIDPVEISSQISISLDN